MFIIAIISLGGSLVIFIANILNFGIKGIFSAERKSTKWAIGLFLLYIVSFVIFLLISSN